MERTLNGSAEQDGLPHLLLAGRELKQAAARVAFADFLAGQATDSDVVWTVQSASGRVVTRDGRLQVDPIPDARKGRDA